MKLRPANPGDTGEIVDLVLQHASARSVFDTLLWQPAPHAAQKITASLQRHLANPDGQFRWLVMQGASGLVGVAHLAIITPPPVYDLNGGLAGLILDDSFVSAGQPEETLQDLFAEAENYLQAKGAVRCIAACPSADARKLKTCLSRNFRPVTHYMVKHGLTDTALLSGVRGATPSDVPQLVAFNRQARERLEEANRTMWTSHKDAETRFSLWMNYSLTLSDRAIFVAGTDCSLSGFIIAQPASLLQLPDTCEDGSLGVIDDFHGAAFGSSLTHHGPATGTLHLLAAAEADFRRRGKTSVMAVCPASWPAKSNLLQMAGYRTANMWLLNDASDAKSQSVPDLRQNQPKA